MGYSLNDLNYWYAVTTDYVFTVADIIVINEGPSYQEKPYIFKRHRSLCWYDGIRDYAFSYQPDIQYIKLINNLKRKYAHLRVNPRGLRRIYDSTCKTSDSFSFYGPRNIAPNP